MINIHITANGNNTADITPYIPLLNSDPKSSCLLENASLATKILVIKKPVYNFIRTPTAPKQNSNIVICFILPKLRGLDALMVFESFIDIVPSKKKATYKNSIVLEKKADPLYK